MKFYDRTAKLNALETIDRQTDESGKMTVITGRRRVGKTMMALKFSENKRRLYFFVSKKNEQLLCDEFLKMIKDNFKTPVIGEIKTFSQVFELTLQLAAQEKLLLIIDEFQEFYNVNPAVYSEIQHLWDRYKYNVKLHLVLIGSVYSLMVKIFENAKEPLFGRADRFIHLKPFRPKIIKDILLDYDAFNLDIFFVHYIITGGIPRYIEILSDNRKFRANDVFDFVLQKDSPFLNEGKNLLIEEFGNKHGTYFSILELIASGKTDRSAIESILEKNIGGHLDRLESIYDVVAKIKPFDAKPSGRVQKYLIKDNFLNFWFRFIHKCKPAVEMENFDYIMAIVQRDFSTYSGRFLEKLFHELIAETREYNRIGTYWEKGHQNEIDLVAVNDLKKKMLLAEIKVNPKRISIEALKRKARKLTSRYQNFDITYKGLSVNDIAQYLD